MIEPTADLSTRLDAHQNWLESAGSKGAKLVLAHERLTGVDLGGRDLSEAEFYDCDLSHASLRRTALIRSHIYSSRLDHADLSLANLYKCEASQTTAMDASFWNSNLSRVWFVGNNMTRADFSQSWMLRSVFDDCDLTRSLLLDVDFDRTAIINVRLLGVEARGARGWILPPLERTEEGNPVTESLGTGGAEVTYFDAHNFDRNNPPPWRHANSDVPYVVP